jgi:hypothetical protein
MQQLQRQVQDQDRRNQNRFLALHNLNDWTKVVRAKCLNLKRAAKRIGSAYAIAADWHNKALGERAKSRALRVQILFEVLSALTAGAFSWVSTAAQTFCKQRLTARLTSTARQFGWPAVKPRYSEIARDLFKAAETKIKQRQKSGLVLIEGIEDAVQAGVSGMLGDVAPLAFPSPDGEGVSVNPLYFQDQLEDYILELEEMAVEYLGKVNNEMANWPKKKWDSYDNTEFQTAIGWWRKEADYLAGVESLPGGRKASSKYQIQAMAWELERGMWAKWMPSLRTIRSQEAPAYRAELRFPSNTIVYESLCTSLTDRFADLAILKEAGVTPHWWKSAESEDKPLIAWAAKYKSKPWAKGESEPPTVTEA